MITMQHRISVVLCTYNGEKYIADQIQSILDQTRLPDELIIVDDHSNDHTVSIVEKILHDSKMMYQVHVNEVNLGVVRNFEKGMGLSTGDILFTCDQDDLWVNHKVERMLVEFDKNPRCLLVFSDAILVNQDRVPFAYRLWDVNRVLAAMFDQKRYYDELLKKRVVTGATMALRQELFEKTRPFPAQSWLHDGWLAINAPLHGDMVAIREPLIEYRQHGNNSVGASKLNFIKKLKRYTKNLQSIEPMDVQLHKEYVDFLAISGKLIAKKNQTKHVEDCIRFWSDSIKMKHVGRIQGLKLIANCIANQGYQKFHYGGLRGIMVDIACVLRFKGK